ncbi:MAG TPA: outer membrane beta-barrel protein [Solirubrobacterales bacterium]
MKGILTRIIFPGALVALVAAPLAAQGGLMLGGGLTLPKSDYEDVVEEGWHGMAGFDFVPAGTGLGIRVDGAYHLNSVIAPVDLDAAVAIIAVSGNGVFHFAGSGISPYLMGGVTWASANCSGDDCISEESESDVGYNVGGGLRFGSLFVEARYVSISGDVDADFIPITLGFHF